MGREIINVGTIAPVANPPLIILKHNDNGVVIEINTDMFPGGTQAINIATSNLIDGTDARSKVEKLSQALVKSQENFTPSARSTIMTDFVKRQLPEVDLQEKTTKPKSHPITKQSKAPPKQEGVNRPSQRQWKNHTCRLRRNLARKIS